MRYFKFIMSIFFLLVVHTVSMPDQLTASLFSKLYILYRTVFCGVITNLCGGIDKKGLKLRTDVDAKKVGEELNLNGRTSTRKKIINHKIRATDIKNVSFFFISYKCKICYFRIKLFFYFLLSLLKKVLLKPTNFEF